MDVMVSRCAGIDIGKAEVVVCLRVPGPRGKRISQVRTFSAVAGQINGLADWLAEHQVSHVVMEATGQYWKPVWDVLAESGFVHGTVLLRRDCCAQQRHPRAWSGA